VLRRLTDDPRVAWASPIGFGDHWGANPIVGATAELVTRGGRRQPHEGRVFAAWHEVVVGADVKLALGARFTPAHGMSEAEEGHAHEGFDYEVVGRLPREGTPWDRAIVAPIEAVWDVHSLPTGHDEATGRIGPPWPTTPAGVPAIVIKPRSVADAYRL